MHLPTVSLMFLASLVACTVNVEHVPAGAGVPATDAVQCGPSSAAQVDGSCVSVGPGPRTDSTDPMAAAFLRAPDGWGEIAVAADQCSETELSVLGQAECKPVDDCSAPFPPPNADAVVSATLTGPNVVTTLGAALAGMPAGAIIAIDSGHYPSLKLAQNVTLVGRCASQTIVGDGVHNAVYVNGATAKLHSLTLTSDAAPIAVAQGSIQADRVILRSAHVAAAALGPAASVTLTRSLIAGPGGDWSGGGMAAGGGQITVLDSEIRGVSVGLWATDPGSHITLERQGDGARRSYDVPGPRERHDARQDGHP